MEKYFEQGTLDEADILPNINTAIANSKLCPVFAVSSITQVGLRALLNGLVDYAPDPAHHEAEYGRFIDGGPDGDRIPRKYSDSEPFSAYCFRTIADPFAGRINVAKIISGHLKTELASDLAPFIRSKASS
jgi:elongation factor G